MNMVPQTTPLYLIDAEEIDGDVYFEVFQIVAWDPETSKGQMVHLFFDGSSDRSGEWLEMGDLCPNIDAKQAYLSPVIPEHVMIQINDRLTEDFDRKFIKDL